MAEKTLLEDIAVVAGILSANGWAEANAGNISVRSQGADGVNDRIPGDMILVDSCYDLLNDRKLLMTATGSRMRDVAEDPAGNVILIEVVEGKCRMIGGDGMPTSELLIHLAVHDMLLSNRPEHRAVVHAHPPELISFSHLAVHEPGDTLMRMHPETYFKIPHGIGFVPYQVPGTAELARSTEEALLRAQVAVWSVHGAVATGETPSDALDGLEIANKAAKLYITTAGAGGSPGLTSDEVERTIKFRDSVQD